MSFELIGREKVSYTDSQALTLQDESMGVLMTDSTTIEVAFDAAADPTCLSYNGNYRIKLTNRRHEDVHPGVVEMYGKEWPQLGPLGNRLHYELTRYPASYVEDGCSDPLAGFRRAVGISHKIRRDGLTRIDTFSLTVGAEAIEAAVSKLPADCWTFGVIEAADNSFYSQQELEMQTAANGNLIVQSQPHENDGLSMAARTILPLHDNSMHLQSVAIFGTPAVRGLLKEQFALLGEREGLDVDGFFDAGPELMLSMAADYYATDWVHGNFTVPYCRLRQHLSRILAPSKKAAFETEAATLKRMRTDKITDEEYAEAKKQVDAPGNVHDALDEMAASIPQRYVNLSRL
jgi:hypothetical protein